MFKAAYTWFFLAVAVFCTSLQSPQIQWLTLSQAYELIKTQPRKVFVDVYTDWCGWCKKMDRETFSQPYIIQYANEKFYAVKLNAESREPIKLGDKILNFIPQGPRGYHEAAVGLLNGQMSYPSIVFLDENFAIIERLPGYKDAKTFHQIITFLGGNHYKQEPFDKFQQGTYVRIYAPK